MTSRPARSLAADALTAGRFVLAIPVGALAHLGEWNLVALVLSLSWLSDFFDGRLTRGGEDGRLGPLDLAADTTVGAGLLAGLVTGGHLHLALGAVAAGAGAGYVGWRNAALAMVLQAIAYGAALWWLADPPGWGLVLAVGTIGIIAVLDRRRLLDHVLPTFFTGLGITGRGNRSVRGRARRR